MCEAILVVYMHSSVPFGEGDALSRCWLPIGLKVTLTGEGKTVVENITKEVGCAFY